MDFAAVANLGVAGFAILVMWWKDQASTKERDMHAKQLDAREQAFHKLENEVRGEISAQLAASTSALRDNAKIMEHVIERLTKQ